MNLQQLNQMKKIAIIAMVSDDYLMGKLVLKGGSAIDIVYQLSGRASIDLDYSMEGKFTQSELVNIKDTIEERLTDVYQENGYNIIDFDFSEQPKGLGPIDEMMFWEGIPLSLN